MFKQHPEEKTIQSYDSIWEFRAQYCPPCPDCKQPMLNMGLGFKPPKRRDLKKWRVLEQQAKTGRRFWYIPSWL